jgi:WS/DGAT/MGAT family acyltransferase
MFERLGLRTEPMSRVDTAWLRMERPTNLMMITGVIMFDGPVDLRRLKETLAERFLAYRRFRQRAVDLPGQSFWEYDKDFDLNWHVRRSALPGAAGKAELQEFVSQLGSTPLDKSKPLWQFHLIENYQGGSALVSRIHHCYADGIALVQVMLSLTDLVPDPQAVDKPQRAKLSIKGGTVFQRLLSPARAGAEQLGEWGTKLTQKLAEWANDPQQLLELARTGAGELGLIAREFLHAVTLPDDPPTLFRGPLGVSKRVAWCDPIPLDEVKTIGRALGCTVNDVLLAAAAGALRAYLVERGQNVDGLTIRATVPVNLRPLEHAKQLGNHFGLVFLDLPIGEPNPLARLYAVHRSMNELKRSRQAVMSFGLLSALGLVPHLVQRQALELFSRKATTVATNVPGPQQPLYLAGQRIREMMFWVPQSGSIGMGISILSYDNKVHFGLIADAKNVPQPQQVIERFQPELEKLMLITLMEDWEAPITPADAAATLQHYVEASPAPIQRRKTTPRGKARARARR